MEAVQLAPGLFHLQEYKFYGDNVYLIDIQVHAFVKVCVLGSLRQADLPNELLSRLVVSE